MKRILIPLLLIVAACSNPVYDEANLRENAMGYLQATSDYDVERAARYATQETIDSTLNFFKEAVMPSMTEESIKRNAALELSIDSVVYLSDTAALVYFHKRTARMDVHDCMGMKLREGGWKAHMVLKSSKPPANAPIPPMPANAPAPVAMPR